MSLVPPHSLNDALSSNSLDNGQLSLWQQSPALSRVLHQLEKAGVRESTVMVVGEPGTGKRFAASFLHASSLRKSGPLIYLGPELRDPTRSFEERGKLLQKACAAAQKGTIFLEEISEFPLALQGALLPFLAARDSQFPSRNKPTDESFCECENVRFVASSSQPLAPGVEQGSFLAELYYQLHVLTIHLPPLRERRDDIPVLIDYYLRQLCAPYQRPPPRLSPELLNYLIGYHWPGNMLQLQNCLEQMLVFQRGAMLSMADLPVRLRHFRSAGTPTLEIPPGMNMQQIEDTAIRQTLERVGGNKEEAANVLGLSLRTIQRWVRTQDRRSNKRPESSVSY